MDIGLNLEGVESSYAANNYGLVFYSLVRTLKPQLVVEFGTYHGYSGMHMAAGLRDNSDVKSELHLVDLWDNYQYRHCSRVTTVDNFRRSRLLYRPNFTVYFDEHRAECCTHNIQKRSIDLMHIDISNCGDTLKGVMKAWRSFLAPQATVIIEGGSRERDNIDWMLKYKRKPIREWLASMDVHYQFDHITLDPFPSLTIMRLK